LTVQRAAAGAVQREAVAIGGRIADADGAALGGAVRLGRKHSARGLCRSGARGQRVALCFAALGGDAKVGAARVLDQAGENLRARVPRAIERNAHVIAAGLLRFDRLAFRSEHIGGIVQRESHIPSTSAIGIDAEIVKFAIWIVEHLSVWSRSHTKEGKKKVEKEKKKKPKAGGDHHTRIIDPVMPCVHLYMPLNVVPRGKYAAQCGAPRRATRSSNSSLIVGRTGKTTLQIILVYISFFFTFTLSTFTLIRFSISIQWHHQL
jgi:hypothetical protein